MADTVVPSEAPSSSSPLNPPSRFICHVCQKQFSQYTCPRCNSRYCSLHCYKTHSLRCTESFMRENVLDEMRQIQPNDETKRKMVDILKRFHSEDEADNMVDDDLTLSEETIEKIISGGVVNIDDLSVEERKRFERAVASGELSKMIEPWEPWWLKPSAKMISLSQDGTQLVQPLASEQTMSEQDDDDVSRHLTEIPSGPVTPLTPLRKLSSSDPSPLLAVHLVDIIFSYCFTLRMYNGDWLSDAIGSAMVVLSISSVLGQGGQPETVLEALSHCLEQTCSPAFRHMGGLQFGFGLIDDVISLLSLGGSALICALCDLQRLIQTGERELRSEKPKKGSRTKATTTLKLAERKVYFITCWVHEQPREAWFPLASIVKAEKDSALEYGSGQRKPGSAERKSETAKKVLIEEVQ